MDGWDAMDDWAGLADAPDYNIIPWADLRGADVPALIEPHILI